MEDCYDTIVFSFLNIYRVKEWHDPDDKKIYVSE